MYNITFALHSYTQRELFYPTSIYEMMIDAIKERYQDLIPKDALDMSDECLKETYFYNTESKYFQDEYLEAFMNIRGYYYSACDEVDELEVYVDEFEFLVQEFNRTFNPIPASVVIKIKWRICGKLYLNTQKSGYRRFMFLEVMREKKLALFKRAPFVIEMIADLYMDDRKRHCKMLEDAHREVVQKDFENVKYPTWYSIGNIHTAVSDIVDMSNTF